MKAEQTGRMGKKAAVKAVSAEIGVGHILERLVDGPAHLGHNGNPTAGLALVYPRCSLAVLRCYQNGVIIQIQEKHGPVCRL